jgi:uncharacterized protein YjbJ (UPF0337 family)
MIKRNGFMGGRVTVRDDRSYGALPAREAPAAFLFRVTPHRTAAIFRLPSVVIVPRRKTKKMKSSTHDKAAGTAKKIAGRVKEATGTLLGNDQLRVEGKAQQIEGRTQKKIGEIKQVFGN